MKKTALALLVFCCAELFAQQEPLQTHWYGKQLTFDMVIHNPNHDRAWHVLKIGVMSTGVQGTFNCFGGATALLPLADYTVHFRIDSKETTVDANPPILIPPSDSARFTLALYPDDRGACGAWAADIQTRVYFEDGRVVSGQLTHLSAELVATSASQHLSFADLSARTQSNDASVRSSAIERLTLQGGNDHAVSEKLLTALNDPDLGVRISAIDKVGDLGLLALAPLLLERAANSGDKQETSAFCRTLGVLKYEPSIPLLVSVFSRNDPDLFVASRDALRSMPSAAIVPLLLKVFRAHQAWGSEEEWMKEESLSYREMISMFFASGDSDALKAVSDQLFHIEQPSLVAYIEQTLRQNQQRSEGVVQFFRGPLENVIRTGSSFERRDALMTLALILPTKDGLALVKGILSDADPMMRAKACSIAGSAAMHILLPQVKSTLSAATSPIELTACCTASRVLDPTITCQTEVGN